MVEITDTKRLVQTECVAKDSFSVQFNSIYRMNLLYGEGEEDRSRICGTVQNLSLIHILIVPMNLCATYDGIGHSAVLADLMSFYNMHLNGIEVTPKIEY